MLNIIKSNWLRTKRQPIRWVLFLAPILYALAFSIYILGPNSFEDVEIYAFFETFAILATFSLSFFVPMLYEADKNASFYTNDIKFGISRKKTLGAKFLLIALLYALIILIASIIFLGMWIIFKNKAINTVEFLTLMALVFFTIIPLIPIYQYLNLKYGQSGSIMVGIFLTLAAILLGTTGLGALIWKFLPFVRPFKIIYLLAQGAISLKACIKFIGLGIIISIIFLTIVANWFNKWDVYAKTED
ncbi:lantibiotic ABC transporter permease [Anaerococcus sp.]|uniref:lantibiotic ABC transporter permease n=1 Tax=Anaerococcus sp. TaxID=1872515 RepID=UPI00257D66E3|nr:lantibiotic ABC transporter permease [Anaerococcus sp.]MBS6105445.1 lantibiotic ABC transporter permease [Anaerococcus sp.]